MVSRRSNNARWPVLLACGFAAFIVATLLSLVYETHFAGDEWRPEWGYDTKPGLAWIAGLTKLQFPMTSRLIRSRHIPAYHGGTVWAKIRIPQAYVDDFLKGIPRSFAQSGKSKLGVTREYCGAGYGAPSWWNPDSSLRFAAAADVDSYHAYRILVDRDDPRYALIYLFWHEYL